MIITVVAVIAWLSRVLT